jgi:DEAD/DEAH box helicase domain-containing protein
LEPHLACAAYELPIEEKDVAEYFGDDALATAEKMAAEGKLALRTARVTKVARYHWRGRNNPGMDLDLRSMGGPVFAIVERETGALLGTVDGSSAFSQVFPGAIYLHQGENWEVVELDLRRSVALVEKAAGSYYTQSRELSDINVLEVRDSKKVGRAHMYLGRVQVTRQVVAFVRKDIATSETLDLVGLDLPEVVLDTVAVWYTADAELVRRAQIDPVDLPGSLHAAEHCGIGMLPLFAMADRWDIGGVSTALSPDTGLPTVFIYDGYAGGAGIAARGFAKAAEHLAATLEVLRTCPCEKGCPSCVQSPKCGNGNEPLDKAGAMRLLATILG